jgi:molybdate transport system substrate-binding protein
VSGLLSRLLAAFFVSLFAFPVSASAATLTVAAAADISSLSEELTAGFHQMFPSDTVRFAFGASGSLAEQIENGAPYDLFLSANEAFVDQLAAAGKIVAGSNQIYAMGRLGVLWRDGKSHNLKDLQESWVRLFVIANPKLAPYGVAAQQTLEHAGLWRVLQPKIVYGENVRQALQMFDSGNTEAVLTAYSLLVGRPGASSLPDDWHNPIRQKAGIVAASQNQEGARHFLAFLTGAQGHAILLTHGLEPAH